MERLRIQPYSLEVPDGSTAWVSLGLGNTTQWRIDVGRFQFFFHLDSEREPSYLADFILSCTKQKVELRRLEVNGISGATYGDYSMSRSWIDWWFKKGDVMICINLQAYGDASADEKELHEKIITSLRYLPDKQIV